MRLLCCSFLNFLEDLSAVVSISFVAGKQKQTKPCTAEAKSASQRAAPQTDIAKFPGLQNKGLGMSQCLYMCGADIWKLKTWQVHSPWTGTTHDCISTDLQKSHG